MPALPDILAIAAAVFAAAAWIVPLVRMALWKQPRTSLAGVGQAIGFVVLAACLSAAGLGLALLTLVFSSRAAWGWCSAAAIVAFWISLWAFLAIANRFARRGAPAAERNPAPGRS